MFPGMLKSREKLAPVRLGKIDLLLYVNLEKS